MFSSGLLSTSLVGDKVIGASPQAIEFVAGLAFQSESLRGNEVLWPCSFDDGGMDGAGEEIGIDLDGVDG